MRTHFLLMLTFAGLVVSNCNQTTATPGEQTEELSEETQQESPEELQAELQSMEEAEPLKYLEAEYRAEENLVKTKEAGLFSDAEYGADGWIITGTITSSATLATFKDIELTIGYVSATGTEISNEKQTVYMFIMPKGAAPFEFIVHPPKETRDFTLTLNGATPTVKPEGAD